MKTLVLDEKQAEALLGVLSHHYDEIDSRAEELEDFRTINEALKAQGFPHYKYKNGAWI